MKRGTGTMRSGLVTVPMAGVQAALDAGKKALESRSRKPWASAAGLLVAIVSPTWQCSKRMRSSKDVKMFLL